MKVISSQWSGVSKSFFAFALSALLFAFCSPANAQQTAKVHLIGYLSAASAEADKDRFAHFQRGMYELGYIEGKTSSSSNAMQPGNLKRSPNYQRSLFVSRSMFS
jgi:hypothetical protein